MTTKAELVEAIRTLNPDTGVSLRMTKADLESERDRQLTQQTATQEEPRTLGDLHAQGADGESGQSPDSQPEDAESGPGTDLEIHDQPSTLPAYSRWVQMEAMADKIAKSALIPDDLRRKPADVLLILLAGHDVGIPATQALQKIHVIKGRVGMAAELMVALVVSQGHDIWPDPGNDAEQATAHGQRKGSERTGSFTFTMDDARKAQLVQSGGSWTKYPKAMLWARAVSGLVRQMFPDCTSGISYTPEELGSIDVDGYESPVARQPAEPVYTPAPEETKQAIRDRLAELTDEQRACVAEAWKVPANPALHPLAQLNQDEVGTVLRIIADCVQAHPPDADVVDAEIVPDDPVAQAEAFVASLDAQDDGECKGCTCVEPLNAEGYCADCAKAKAEGRP